MGWKVDDIVSPEAVSAAKQFECPICFTIWDDPVETSCCESMFCRGCILQYTTCPICGGAMGGVKPGSKQIIRMLHAVQAQCPYAAVLARASPNGRGAAPEQQHPAKRAKAAVCSWRGTYGDFIKKHQGQCGACPVSCPEGCGEMVPRCDLNQHRQRCVKILDKCEICGELLRPADMDEHLKESAEFHVLLLQDRLQQALAQAQAAAAVAEPAERRADPVAESLELMPRRLQQHVTNITRLRTDEIKREVRRQLTKSFVLIIRNGRTLRERTSKGCAVTSPTFCLCGHEFMLNMYPHGQRGDLENSMAFWRFAMNGDCDQRVHVKFTINDEHSLADEDWASNMVYKSWPSYRDVMDSCVGDDIKVCIEILNMSDTAVMGEADA